MATASGPSAKKYDVPRLGLTYAIAGAIQESKLVNVPDGHADSAGLDDVGIGWAERHMFGTDAHRAD